jgi:hypothetical protein
MTQKLDRCTVAGWLATAAQWVNVMIKATFE